MANEPERPIEKLLRAAAQKRRDEAGAAFELHPADRRLLQGEVARKFAPPQRPHRSFPEAFALFWPRVAGGVAVVALLGLAVWALLPVPAYNKREASLARDLALTKNMPTKEPLFPAAPPPTAVAPQPEPTAKSESPMLAYADKDQSVAAKPPGQVALTLSQTPEPNAALEPQSVNTPKLGTLVTERFATPQEPTLTQLAASAGTTVQAPAEFANGGTTRRYGFAGRSAPPTSVPATPAAQAIVAMAPAAPTASLGEQSAKAAGDLSQQNVGLVAAPANEPAQLTDGKLVQTGTFYRSIAAAAPANRPGQPSIAADHLSVAGAEPSRETKAVTAGQRFVQVAPESRAEESLADRGAAPNPVLASFRVEQAGQVLRIIDNDGSVYTGSLQLARTARPSLQAKADLPAAAPVARIRSAPAGQNTTFSLGSVQLPEETFAFRVVGTNRSLQKKVVFSGNLLTASNLTSSLRGATNRADMNILVDGAGPDALLARGNKMSLGSPARASQNTLAPEAFRSLPFTRISGKLVIGSGKPVEINALPAKP